MMIQIVLKDYAISTIAISLLHLFLNLNNASAAVLLIYAPVLLLLNKLFLKKERSMTSLLVFDSFLFAAVAIAFFFLAWNLSIIERLVDIPLLIAFSAYVIKDSIKESDDHSILRIFDSALISFLIIFAYSSFYANLNSALFIQLSGIAASLFALVTERAGGVRNLRPSTIVIMLFTCILIIILSRYASILGDGAIYLGNLIMAIGFMFYRFFDWLFSLIPKFPPNLNSSYIPNASDNRYRSPDILKGTISDNTFKIIVIITMSIIAIAILMLVLRKVRIGRKTKEKRRNTKSIRKVSLGAAISKAIKAVKDAIRKELFIMRNKDNPIGLALWLEKKLIRDKRRKRDGECYHNFLSRLAIEENQSELLAAADDFDCCLYSYGVGVPSEIAGAKAIRKEIRKQLFYNRVLLKLRISKKK